jgi:hypothetical protein
MNSILEDKSILKDRLEKLQTAISKATDDAWKQSTTTTSPRSVSAGTSGSNNNASFLLGMDLFGQDVSVLERGIQDKLDDVEDELEKLVAAAADQAQPDESMMMDVSTTSQGGGEEEDPEFLAELAKSYKKHIRFLKKASLARTALDESTTLSSAALATTEIDLLQASKELMTASEHVRQAQGDLATTATATSSSEQQERQVERANQIITSLRQGIRRHRVELVHKAASVLDTSIQLNNGHNSSSTTTASSCGSLSAKASTQLEAAYQVLETLEGGHSALEESMRRLTRRLYQEVLEPVLEPHLSKDFVPVAPWKVLEAADKPSKGLVGVSTVTSKGTVHRLEWQRDEDETTIILQTPIAAWKNTLQLLDRILSFVQSKVLLERPKLCELVGTKLFGRPHALPSALKLEALGLESSRLGDDRGVLMETLVELLLRTSLPDTPLESAASLRETRQGLVDICIPFCRSLAAKSLLVEPDARPKLVAICQDLEKLYVDHRRCLLLNRARDILVTTTDYHNTVRVGVEVASTTTGNDMNGNADDAAIKGVFQLHRSSISETASQLMALVRATMDESVDAVKFTKSDSDDASPTALSLLRPTLYRTARDMLHLFRAMIPASQGAEIRQVPRTAAVLHNDCLFLAHHCLTLGLEYKERFGDEAYGTNEEEIRGKLLRQTCLFVDMVPLFRELADQCMGDMLDTQKLQVAELVGARISYFGKSLASNESLHEWSEAETALAAGIYHLRHLSQAWKSVLSAEVYGRSMGYLADVLLALFLRQVLSATVISPTASAFVCGLFRKALDDLRPIILSEDTQNRTTQKPNAVALEWDRFTAIRHCLEMPTLSDVQTALSRGVFRSVVGQELARLIRAKHPQDSRERNHLLNQLATVGE